MLLRSNFPYHINQLYHFELNNFMFDNLTQPELHNIFKKGNNISPFLEIYFSKVFKLQYVNKPFHDFIDVFGNKIEQKTFTKYGCHFLPSTYRNYHNKNEFELMNIFNNNIYLLCDITQFPKIQVIFKKGYDLFQQFPDGKICFSQKNILFN